MVRVDAVYLKNGVEQRVPVVHWDGQEPMVIAGWRLEGARYERAVEIHGALVRLEERRDPAQDWVTSILPRLTSEIDRILKPRAAPKDTLFDDPPGFIAGIAEVCHEVNRAYCESTGDLSQVSWDEAAQSIRDSAVNGVIAVVDDPDITPTALHEKWRAFKAAEGWVYGTEKDPVKKTHPCMVPYSDLPAFQRVKDSLFRATATAALKALGIGVIENNHTH